MFRKNTHILESQMTKDEILKLIENHCYYDYPSINDNWIHFFYRVKNRNYLTLARLSRNSSIISVECKINLQEAVENTKVEIQFKLSSKIIIFSFLALLFSGLLLYAFSSFPRIESLIGLIPIIIILLLNALYNYEIKILMNIFKAIINKTEIPYNTNTGFSPDFYK